MNKRRGMLRAYFFTAALCIWLSSSAVPRMLRRGGGLSGILLLFNAPRSSGASRTSVLSHQGTSRHLIPHVAGRRWGLGLWDSDVRKGMERRSVLTHHVARSSRSRCRSTFGGVAHSQQQPPPPQQRRHQRQHQRPSTPSSSSIEATRPSSSSSSSFRDSRLLNQKIVAAKDPEEVMQVAMENFDRLNHINVVTSIHRIAKLNKNWFRELKLHDLASERLINRTVELFDGDYPTENLLKTTFLERKRNEWTRLVARLESDVGMHDARGIASILWSFAALEHVPSKATMDEIKHSLRLFIPALTSQGVSNSIWALARLNKQVDQELVEALLGRSLELRMQWSPQCVSNCLWALASMEYYRPMTTHNNNNNNNNHHHNYLKAVEGELMEKLKFFKPQEMSSLFWSMAKLSYTPKDEWMKRAEYRLSACVSFLKPQELSNIMWAYAKLAVQPSNTTLISLQEQGLRRISSLKPQAIGNIMWALAKLQTKSIIPELVTAIEEASVAKMSDFNMQNTHNMLWAFATLQLQNRPSDLLLNSVQNHVFSHARVLTPADIANNIWSSAMLSVKVSDRLFKVLQYQAMEKMGLFNAQELANVLWGMGTLSQRPHAVFMGAFEKQAVDVMDTFTLHEIGSSLAGYGKLSVSPSPKLFRSMVTHLQEHTKELTTAQITTISWALGRLYIIPSKRSSKRRRRRRDQYQQQQQQHQQFPSYNHYNEAYDEMQGNALLLNDKGDGDHDHHHPYDQMLEFLEGQSISRIKDFSMTELSTLLWVYAKTARLPPDPFVAAIEGRIQQQQQQQQHDTNTVVEQTTADRRHLLPPLSPYEISNILWSAARLGLSIGKDTMELLQDKAVEVIDLFTPKGISNSLWAIIKLTHNKPSRSLLIALQEKAMMSVDHFTSQDIAKILWALASAEHRTDVSQKLIISLHRRALAIDSYTEEEAVSVLWGFSKLSVQTKGVLLNNLKKAQQQQQQQQHQ